MKKEPSAAVVVSFASEALHLCAVRYEKEAERLILEASPRALKAALRAQGAREAISYFEDAVREVERQVEETR